MPIKSSIAGCRWAAWLILICGAAHAADTAPPQSRDPRLVMELLAEQPQIVTPTGIDVDRQGRVFVAESHTHFRPDNYDGPAADRILVFQPGGAAGGQPPAVFHEGFTHVMDLEFNEDGWLYVATRMDIHRLRDSDGDLRADVVEPVVRMETSGTYPHNGLSGLAFDFAGGLHFGLGENLGHDYTLVGRDGTRVSGGGEGGSTYHVLADGSELRRTSTGWWNPWGMCVDSWGRVFGTDNDPGASPPCRLIQLVDQADYGYEYRYGRTGLHPLITWTGNRPGTVPMVAGTGEAPCAVVAYESDALPPRYRGGLLVASWADHRIEYYPLRQTKDAALVATERQVLFEGGSDFRPVGLAIAPDGTVLVSDWVSSSYELHKQGRIWRIRPQQWQPPQRSAKPRQALLSADRRTRERAARMLVFEPDGRQWLREQLRDNQRERVRSAALQALIAVADEATDFVSVAKNDVSIPLRRLAVSYLARNGAEVAWLTDSSQPAAVRAAALPALRLPQDEQRLVAALGSADQAVFHAAVVALRRQLPMAPAAVRLRLSERFPLALLLAARRTEPLRSEVQAQLPDYLQDPDPEVRFAAIKWIADEKLAALRPQVARLLDNPTQDYRLFLAASAALDRLDGRKPVDVPAPQLLLEKLTSDSTPAAVRAVCLRMLDPATPGLRWEQLASLFAEDNPQLQVEVVRTMAGHPDPRRAALLRKTAGDRQRPTQVRAAAVAALGADPQENQELLLQVAVGAKRDVLRQEALRSLVGAALTDEQRRQLQSLADQNSTNREAVARLVDGAPATRPAPEDTDAWQRLAAGPGDPQAGERIFFGVKVGTCASCHQYRGRGRAVGPPLTLITQRLAARSGDARRWLLETLLQPSKDMAPQYSTWLVRTKQGKVLSGLPRRKGGNAEAYLGLDGKEFVVRKRDIQSHRESGKSLMPEGLLAALTTQELRDLLAFLEQKN